MVTDTLGNVTGNITYEAYGETASGDVETEIKVTGQRLVMGKTKISDDSRLTRE